MNPHFFTAPFYFAFIWFRVQGRGGGFAAFFLLGDARKWHLSHQALVTPTIRGKESSYMCGMKSFGSVPLVLAGVFTHGSFSSAQDDDTRGRMGSHLGDTLHVLELSVLYTIRVAP